MGVDGEFSDQLWLWPSRTKYLLKISYYFACLLSLERSSQIDDPNKTDVVLGTLKIVSES